MDLRRWAPWMRGKKGEDFPLEAFPAEAEPPRAEFEPQRPPPQYSQTPYAEAPSIQPPRPEPREASVRREAPMEPIAAEPAPMAPPREPRRPKTRRPPPPEGAMPREEDFMVIVEGGGATSRFRIEVDDLGLVFKSGPAPGLKWSLIGGVAGMVLIGTALASIGIAQYGLASALAGKSSLAVCGMASVVIGILSCLPGVVALSRGVHLVIDARPGRARYRGPTADTEFPLGFITGVKAENAFYSRAVLLDVRGRGPLFLFYTTKTSDIAAFRDAVQRVAWHMRGRRV